SFGPKRSWDYARLIEALIVKHLLSEEETYDEALAKFSEQSTQEGRILYVDPDAHCAYLPYRSGTKIAKTVESQNLLVDLAKDGSVVGV
ncbi:hypothetical protein OK868_11630, partial [Streptococcus pneumoniae]|nr:hypothetical protein [Streptococcus pneumoniae]